MTKKSIAIYLALIGSLLVIVIAWYVFAFQTQPTFASATFDGQRAYTDVQTQVAFGPRIPGSAGHAKVQEWMRDELVKAGWQVEIQESEAMGHPVENIVATRGNEDPQIIIGAHYDSRMTADKDPDPAKAAARWRRSSCSPPSC